MLHPLTFMLLLAPVEACEPLAYVTSVDELSIQRHANEPAEPSELCVQDKVERGEDNIQPDPEIIFTDRDKRIMLKPLSLYTVRPVESCEVGCWLERVLGVATNLMRDQKDHVSASVAMLPADSSDPYAWDIFDKSKRQAFSKSSDEIPSDLPFDPSDAHVNLNAPIFNVPTHLSHWLIPMDTFAIDEIQIVDLADDNPFQEPIWKTKLKDLPNRPGQAMVPLEHFRGKSSLRLFLRHRDGVSMHRLSFHLIDRSLEGDANLVPQLAYQLLEQNTLSWAFYSATILEQNHRDLALELYFGHQAKP